MIRWFLHRMIGRFETRYGYDARYLHEILDLAGPGALIRFSRVQGLGDYHQDLPTDVWFAARLAAFAKEDCGPCTQLAVTMAEEAGVPHKTLIAVLDCKDEELSEDARLAVRFVRSALARDPEADTWRERVVHRFGPRGLVTLAYTLTAARMYPTLKYAMGHGQSCVRVEVGDIQVSNAVHAT